MKILLDGPVRTGYGQILLVGGDEIDPSPEEAFRDQENGLCGAAVAGALFLSTGLRFGVVGLRVELHAGEPPPDETWEEVVEVSFRQRRNRIRVAELDGDGYPLRLTRGVYRVRYAARGMDAGREEDQRYEGEPVDHYLLQFWPGPAARDRIVRRTSDAATYWHRENRGRALPAENQEAEDRQLTAAAERYFRKQYGGVLPNARLRAVDGYTAAMVLIDRDLLLALSELEDVVLREIARWCAWQALDVAGLTDHRVVAEAVTALRAGRELPAPFDGVDGWRSVAGEVTERTRVPFLAVLNADPRGEQPSRELYALSALDCSSIEDPLAAAVASVDMAVTAFGSDGYARFLAGLRDRFLGARHGNGTWWSE